MEDDVSSPELSEVRFSHTQRVRGLLHLGAFVVLRAVLARAWDRFFGGGYSTDPAFLAFLGGIFLLLSVGLVYLGFTRWVGVDLRAWWIDRRCLWGDLARGIVGAVAVLAQPGGCSAARRYGPLPPRERALPYGARHVAVAVAPRRGEYAA